LVKRNYLQLIKLYSSAKAATPMCWSTIGLRGMHPWRCRHWSGCYTT